MATTSPTRIDEDLFESAKLAGAVTSRSASQQVVHWARLGRELELSGRVSARDVRDVLAGSRSYDSLTAEAQAVVRAMWAERMDELRAGLDLAAELVATGRPYAELDEAGSVVVRNDPPVPRTDPVIEEARKLAANLTPGQRAAIAERSGTPAKPTKVAAKRSRGRVKSATTKPAEERPDRP